jgi:hypothetical protein
MAKMYEEAMATMHKELVKRTPANDMLYIAELRPKVNRETRH